MGSKARPPVHSADLEALCSGPNRPRLEWVSELCPRDPCGSRAGQEAGTLCQERVPQSQHIPTGPCRRKAEARCSLPGWVEEGLPLASSELGRRSRTGPDRVEIVSPCHFLPLPLLMPCFILMVPLVAQGQICCAHYSPRMIASLETLQGPATCIPGKTRLAAGCRAPQVCPVQLCRLCPAKGLLTPEASRGRNAPPEGRAGNI